VKDLGKSGKYGDLKRRLPFCRGRNDFDNRGRAGRVFFLEHCGAMSESLTNRFLRPSAHVRIHERCECSLVKRVQAQPA